MRDQSCASSAMLPASQSYLWFRVKCNWTCPWHRPAHESKWINQQHLQDQTQQGCPTACRVSKAKKEMGGLGKQRYLHILLLGYQRTTLQWDSGHKWKDHSWVIRIWASLRTLFWAVLWHGPQRMTDNHVSLWLTVIHEMRGQEEWKPIHHWAHFSCFALLR